MAFRTLFAALTCAALAACAIPSMAVQQPTLDNVQALRATDVPPLTLGSFSLASGLPAHLDRSLGIRGSILRPPDSATFSQYLRQTLETELRASGKLEPDGPVLVVAQLTQNLVDSEPPNGGGVLGARFVVTRSGRAIYDQELVVRDEWRTSFAAAIAVPAAMDHYTALYPALVRAFVTDPRFREALREN